MMLLSQQLSDRYREELNEALTAGYALDLSVGRNGLNIQMYGFSGKIKEFFFKVVNCPCLNPNAKKNKQSSFLESQSDPDAQRFKRVKDTLNSALRNSFERKLFEQVTHLYLPMITTHPFYTPQEQVDVLQDLTYTDLKDFQKKIMKQSKLTGLFVGNILKDETLELGEVLKVPFTTHIVVVQP
jgi:secreted Zn-dependent insulinase-like peptidase